MKSQLRVWALSKSAAPMSAMPDAASRCPRKWHLLFAPGISFSWLKIALTKLCTYPSAFVRDPKIHLHVVHHSGQGTDNHLIYTESLPLPKSQKSKSRFCDPKDDGGAMVREGRPWLVRARGVPGAGPGGAGLRGRVQGGGLGRLLVNTGQFTMGLRDGQLVQAQRSDTSPPSHPLTLT